MYCYILTLPPIKGVVILRIIFFFGDFVADLEEELFFKCGKNVETQRKWTKAAPPPPPFFVDEINKTTRLICESIFVGNVGGK